MFDVVIVGGGPAGIAAAMQFQRESVLLLEQCDSLGGRLKSHPRGDYWMNLGGHLFPRSGSCIFQIIENLGLEGVEIPGIKTALAYDGKVYATRRVEAYPFVLPLSIRERVSLAVKGLKVMRFVRSWNSVIRRGPGESEQTYSTRVSQFESGRTLRDFLGKMPESIDSIFRSAGRRSAAELDEQSAGVGISLFGALWVGKGSQSQVNLRGGSGTLSDAVRTRLGERVIAGAQVISISHIDNHAEVTYEKADTVCTVSARHVIVAVPAPIACEVVHGLTRQVEAALRSVTYGAFVCMGVITDEVQSMPWDGLYAITTPGMAFDMLFNHANPLRLSSSPRAPGGSLMCYAGGKPARELLDLSEDEIEKKFREDLYRIYPQLRTIIRETVVQKWKHGNVFRTPQTQFEGMLRYQEQSDNIVHFAGDYFAEQGGTIEAATKSGIEAAAGVKRLLGDRAV